MGQFKKQVLDESFARLHQHTQEREIGLISASRGNLDAATNNKRFQELKGHVRKAGYGFVHVKGRYIENHGTPDAKPVDEKSLLVIGQKGKKGGLLKHLKKWGEHFDQDSVLHKSHDSPTAQLHGTSGRENAWPSKGETHDVGKWHPNRAGEFHSLLKGKPSKTFNFEEYAFFNPISWFSRKETLF